MIRHFRKDGSQIENISGYVIKPEDCKELYHVFDMINTRIANEKGEIGNEFCSINARRLRGAS